ncbi:MAG: TRAP transporter small permease subunit [Cyanobacteriota bacterium]|jgi:TRAP-type mannitol/chloroaromatic compound transport system permease small subunit|nr:TRAP transporter small permease subunit [Cyanobacteriota bacterium]
MTRWLALADRIDALNRAAARLSRWALLLMLALGTWNVVGRYAGLAVGRNLSSNALIEGQWQLFDLMFLLAMGYALQRDDHVRVDVLQSRWPARRQRRVELAGTLALLLPFVVVVLIASVEPTLSSWRLGETSPDPGGLPRYWVKSLIPLGFLLLGLQGVAQAIRLVHGQRMGIHDHSGEG